MNQQAAIFLHNNWIYQGYCPINRMLKADLCWESGRRENNDDITGIESQGVDMETKTEHLVAENLSKSSRLMRDIQGTLCTGNN